MSAVRKALHTYGYAHAIGAQVPEAEYPLAISHHNALQRLRQYLYACTSKASKTDTSKASKLSEYLHVFLGPVFEGLTLATAVSVLQFWYFFTSKASKLSTSLTWPRSLRPMYNPRGVCLCSLCQSVHACPTVRV